MKVYKMTYRQFARLYPQYHMPQYKMLLIDPSYVCRFTKDSMGQIVNLEVGYENDTWSLE